MLKLMRSNDADIVVSHSLRDRWCLHHRDWSTNPTFTNDYAMVFKFIRHSLATLGLIIIGMFSTNIGQKKPCHRRWCWFAGRHAQAKLPLSLTPRTLHTLQILKLAFSFLINLNIIGFGSRRRPSLFLECHTHRAISCSLCLVGPVQCLCHHETRTSVHRVYWPRFICQRLKVQCQDRRQLILVKAYLLK